MMYFSKYKLKRLIKMTTLILSILGAAQEIFNLYRNNKNVKKSLKR